MKSFLHKSFSILMTFLVLCSTVSFTIEKHFCGDVLVNVSVFSESEKCQLEAQELLLQKKCCKDEVDVIKGQKDLKVASFDDLDFIHQQFVTAYTYSFINLFGDLEKQIIPHKDYSPPLLVADLQVLDQVFII